MSLKTRKLMAAWFLSLFLIFAVVGGAYAYSSVLSFGDSLSDNGYYQGYPGGTAGNTNPADVYGFRRYSNGPVWVEYLAQDLGVSLFDMAYGGATTAFDNPAAFAATGSSMYLTQTGLQWQVGVYAANYAGISADTLVTVWAGGNDMFNARNPLTAATNIALAVQNLIALGGQSFVIPNLTNNNAWVAAFDPALAVAISGLRATNPGISFYEMDLNMFTPVVDNYTGTWLTDSCENNPGKEGCKTGTFLNWDAVHPATQTHQQFAALVASQVPEPVSIILLIIGFAGLMGARRRMK